MRTRAIDADVKRLMLQAYANAKTLLQAHGAEVYTLAKERMREETLAGDRVCDLFGVKAAKTPPARTQARQRLVATRRAARRTRPRGSLAGDVHIGSAA